MGPYCKFCDSRCFHHPDYVARALPKIHLQKMLRTHGEIMMMASCPGGKAFEKKELGFSADDFIDAEGK